MTTPTAGAGPTHPPNRPGTGSPPPPPPPSKGHLPIAAPVEFRVGDHVLVDGDRPEDGGWRIAEVVTDGWYDGPYARLVDEQGARTWSALSILRPFASRGPDRLPTLAQIVGDAAKVLNAAIVMLGRQWDPTTGPQQDDPWAPEAVDIHLGSAVADIRSALLELNHITTMSSARQSMNSASLPGGPFNHPGGSPDEGLTPGLDAGAGIAPEGSEQPLVGPLAGSSHLAAYPASGGLLPGLVDAASHPTAGGTDGSGAVAPGRDAGASSDPGRRLSERAPEGNGVTPGVGFTVPSAKPWMWSS